MISARARAGFNQMMMRGVQGALLPDPGTGAELLPVPPWTQPPASHAAVLSIASLVFRMLIVIHFSDDRATRAHFAALSRQPAEALSHQAFIDAICEAGNLCCGAVNRDLGTVVPWVGMSTPHIIESQCLRHLGLLRAAHQQHFRLGLAQGLALHLTLCVSASEALDFDFRPAPATPQEQAGELELF